MCERVYERERDTIRKGKERWGQTEKEKKSKIQFLECKIIKRRKRKESERYAAEITTICLF